MRLECWQHREAAGTGVPVLLKCPQPHKTSLCLEVFPVPGWFGGRRLKQMENKEKKRKKEVKSAQLRLAELRGQAGHAAVGGY